MSLASGAPGTYEIVISLVAKERLLLRSSGTHGSNCRMKSAAQGSIA